MHSEQQLAASLGCIVLLAGFGAAPLYGQEKPADDADIVEGQMTAQEAALVLDVDVYLVEDMVDEELELNPVSAEKIQALTLAVPSKSATIYSTYAYIPDFTAYTPYVWPGISHVANGIGTRNTGHGTILLRGAPVSNGPSTPVRAFLYWSQIVNTATTPFTQVVNFNGNKGTGFRIGTGPNPCWGSGQNLVAYRAPVLPYILPGINGDYSVSGLPSGNTTGEDPWNPTTFTFPLSEGASLVVLYTHSSVPAGTWTQIHHPINFTTSVAGTFNYNHFLNLPIQTAAMRHTRIGADGQVGSGLRNIICFSDEATLLSGPFGSAFTQLRGHATTNARGSRDTDWNGQDGEPLNQLWDTHTLDLPSGVITPSPFTTNYQVRYRTSCDCIVPVVHVLTAR